MFGAYVRFKCNYAALRKSSDNQQQHSLDSGELFEIRCEYDCQHHHKGGYWTFFVLAFYVDEQHLDMYTYKVETQQRRR